MLGRETPGRGPAGKARIADPPPSRPSWVRWRLSRPAWEVTPAVPGACLSWRSQVRDSMGPLNQCPAGHLIMAASRGRRWSAWCTGTGPRRAARIVGRLPGPGRPGSQGTSSWPPLVTGLQNGLGVAVEVVDGEPFLGEGAPGDRRHVLAELRCSCRFRCAGGQRRAGGAGSASGRSRRSRRRACQGRVTASMTRKAAGWVRRSCLRSWVPAADDSQGM